MSDPHTVFIIAGPNGAGKTTFAFEYLPHEGTCLNFANADLIAAGLSPLAPGSMAVRAGRLMLAQLDDYVGRRESFAFETTLSGLGYVKRIRDWQAVSYRVELMFLSLPTVEAAIERVARRVRQGGHYIPESVIRRRFQAGREKFEAVYKPIVDAWFEYDNSQQPPILLAEGHHARAN